jgi:DNA-binding response OmpR family regulator
MSSHKQRPVVLVIEDSEDDMFFFRRVLQKAGVECTLIHIADGAAAIRYLEAAAAHDAAHPWPDLVFLDLKLPTFSGFEILGWIRENNYEPVLDVAVLSGSEDTTDVQRALDLGATDYLVKPLPVDQLRARLLRWHERQAAGGPAVASPSPKSSPSR